jgi:hypothetical protein
MNVFQEIPDALAVLHCKGVYSQNPLFSRGQFVYAKRGSGFVRLYKGGATSVSSVSWKDLEPGQTIIAEDKFYLIHSLTLIPSAGQKLVQIAAE